MAEILEWKLREDAHRYLSRQNPPYFDIVKLCNAFASGDQWRGIDTGGMPTPVFNIISRAIQHFVASVTSTDVAIQLSALPFAHVPNTEDGVSAVQISQSEIANILEKWNFSDRLREASSMALSTGDVAIHIWFDASKKPYGGTVEGMSGEICMELVPGSSVLFSNPNNDDVDVQSWVALEGREPVEALKAEAKRWRSNEGEVLSDNDFAGADSDAAEIEMEGDAYGKANFLLVYRKDPETGEITATKFTKDAYIYKDIKTDLHIIPVRWLQWERQPGQYHGKSLTYSVIPNQIVINRMVAMVVYHLMMTAFPAMVYNAEMMEKPSNEVGMAIGVHGLAPGISLNSAATYLEPGQMSSQIIQALNLVWSWTKEALGMSDAAAGLVNPETASGAAIVATAKQASIPLQNFQSSMYTWIEGIGRVLLDVMGTYYGSRPVVMNDQEEPRAVTFDFTAIKNLWMAVRADVGATSYWSEVLQQQTLDNLLKAEKISFIDYLERVSDITIPRKQELIQKLRAEAEATQAQQAAPPTAPTAPATSAQPTADYEAMAVFVEGLPQELQTKLMQLSKQDPQAFEQTVKEMMTQQ